MATLRTPPTMLNTWRNRFQRWALRGQTPTTQPVRLERRRIYILPTRYGYAFALLLLVLFLWSVNYSNSMGFAFTFLLAALAHNSMWQAHDALLGLVIHPGAAQPAFVGDTLHFALRVENPHAQARYGIGIQRDPPAPHYVDVAPHSMTALRLPVLAQRRGWVQLGRIKVLTRFPLGLLQAWSWIEFSAAALVYPKPRGQRPLPPATPLSTGNGILQQGSGSEDYAGLRPYIAGDAPRRIAWKASSRSQQWLVKQFSDQMRPELWLDWALLDGVPDELRLEQLCQWVLKAEAEGVHYGLRLPGISIAPALGEGQRHRCLEALALFNN